MHVILNNIVGVQDAIEAMYFTKRTWTEDLHKDLYELYDRCFDGHGFWRVDIDTADKTEMTNLISKVCKMTKRHITIGRYIDFSFTVVGMHRGGQDDWDSHAKRFENRIIRNSTRLATFENEKSDWYKDKILTTDEAMSILNIKPPSEIEYNGQIYVKTTNGYILKEYENNKDVKRGLYMLSIPSNFIFKVNLTEFSHIYKERNSSGTANPEVKECAEQCLSLINEQFDMMNRQLMLDILN